MNKLFVIILISALSLGLTPQERKLATLALDKAKAAQVEYDKSKQSAIDGWDYASKADIHAWETEQKIVPLEKQIDASHKNEQELADQVQKYKPFWDTGHKLWGIGAIGLGIGILLKHLFILFAAIIILGLILWGLSFLPVFQVLQIPVQIVGRFLRSIRDKIKKKNTP